VRAALVACIIMMVAGTAHAAAYLRVIAQKAPVHSGPGPTYREVYVAERGAVFEVVERGTRGYWFKVILDDGTTGWILGDLVFPFEVVDENNGVLHRMGKAIRRAILGPPPVPFSDVEVSFSAGALGNEGVFMLRPAWVIDQYWSFEGFMGMSPRGQVDWFLGGFGWTLRLAPGAAVGPYVNVGIGATHIRPKADDYVDPEETLMSLDAGGGFEITFKKQITLRTDFRNWTIFNPDKAQNRQEYTGGLAIFF
jgi:hypothetical protein